MDYSRAPYFLESLVVGELQINCYIFGCEATRRAVVIDPGGDIDLVRAVVTRQNAVVDGVLLTHGHYDHLGAVSDAKNLYNCPISIHKLDAECLTNPMVNLSALTGANIVCPPADRLLDDGDTIAVGKLSLEVLHTPGHSRGGVCYRYDSVVFGGDLLFNGSIGRYDLPGGSFPEIENSITRKIYSLPDVTIIYPGHGEPTTVGFEKRHNPFVRQSA